MIFGKSFRCALHTSLLIKSEKPLLAYLSYDMGIRLGKTREFDGFLLYIKIDLDL